MRSLRSAAERLNRECFCMTLDRTALDRALSAEAGDDAFAALVAERTHLFSHAPVFLPKSDEAAMQSIIVAIEAAAELPAYQQAAFARAPGIAARDHGPRGVFMGYDFHLAGDGPKLIEVNTNAGGAFLNAFLARAHVACCAEIQRALANATLDSFEPAVVAMFEQEWRAHARRGALRRIAIVDTAPEGQYLYPEFVLAKRMLERHGYEVLIADPTVLRFEGGVLWAGARTIDLVYNRLVDFNLAAPAHTALREAYECDAVVLTPNPHNHALLADKRNLVHLSDPATLLSWGLDAAHARALQTVPRALQITARNAELLWAERKRYFFKPAAGHGGKAVYRGDKLTKAAWDAVLASESIAQEFAPPGERTIVIGGERVQRKVDVRLYTYAGKPLLAAARLYQGQTTNFRTPGGGFAPVFFV